MGESEFAGKVVMISGATSGIGLAAAEAFAARGARLSLTDLSEAALAETAARLSESGAAVATHAGDIAEEATSEDWAKATLKRFGGIDIAFNNAGIEQPMLRTEDVPGEMARKVFEIDALGVLYAMKHQLPVMARLSAEDKADRSVLNTASMAGVMGAPWLSSYVGAKHAVVGMTRTAAREYARAGVRVNALCPAFFRTRMVMETMAQHPKGPEEAIKAITADIPMRR
ncbi:MAG: SDR family NAD(P)-dependent oxidoreductase, partial [Pseudomonadota bacterium]